MITDTDMQQIIESDYCKRSEIIKELERLTHELEMAIEEKRLFDYFDKQYRIYLVEQMSVSPLFTAKIKDVIELVKGDVIDIITDTDGKPNMYDLFMPPNTHPDKDCNTVKSEFVISMCKQTFINSIIETYRDDSSIITQFLCDFHRQTVIVNDTVYDNIDELLLQLSISNRKTGIMNREKKPMSSMILLLLIMCQSSHYLSYLHLYNAINVIREKAILTSNYQNDCTKKTNVQCAFEDPRANYHAMNGDDSNITEIIINDIDVRPEVGCIIKSHYKIYDTQNDRKVHDVYAETIFNEKSERCLIKYSIT
jgi:hypothetical protein